MENNNNIDQLAKEITAQYMAQIQDAQASVQSQEEKQKSKLKASMVMLRNKAMLWAITGVIMTASLAYLGVAWYTRISNTNAVTFEVADYELAINDNTDNKFLVNLYTYANVTNQKAAPGTKGYIPIKLSARHSEIDVDYTIYIESKMPEELQKHIRLFYLVNKTTKQPVTADLKTDADGKPVIDGTIANVFLTQPGDGTGNSQKLPHNTEKVYVPLEKDTDAETFKGTVNLNKEKLIYIYWEWYLDADEALDANHSDFTKVTENATADDAWQAYCDAWDKYDTDIGKYPQKYVDAMTIHITCTGVQSTPMLKPAPTQQPQQLVDPTQNQQP